MLADHGGDASKVQFHRWADTHAVKACSSCWLHLHKVASVHACEPDSASSGVLAGSKATPLLHFQCRHSLSSPEWLSVYLLLCCPEAPC